MVFVAWFIVYNEDEGEHYLWNRKKAYQASMTLKDIQKVLPPGVSLMDLSPEKLSYYSLRVPIEKRVKRGVLWREVIRNKDGIIESMENSIEHTSQRKDSGGNFQVKACVGWSAYPGKRRWPKE